MLTVSHRYIEEERERGIYERERKGKREKERERESTCSLVVQSKIVLIFHYWHQ